MVAVCLIGDWQLAGLGVHAVRVFWASRACSTHLQLHNIVFRCGLQHLHLQRWPPAVAVPHPSRAGLGALAVKEELVRKWDFSDPVNTGNTLNYLRRCSLLLFLALTQ